MPGALVGAVGKSVGAALERGAHEYRELKQNSFYVLESERNPW